MITITEAAPRLIDDIEHDRQPERFYVARTGPLRDIRVQPGRTVGIGGMPGISKTALTMQLVTDALRLKPDLRALVCNVEMTPRELVERILCRLSKINLSRIQDCSTTEEDKASLAIGKSRLMEIESRLAFCEPPFYLENVIKDAVKFDARLIVLDYVQRLKPDENTNGEKRAWMDTACQLTRQMAMEGAAVVCVSAVNRGIGGNYSDLGLGSFRDSSELEYGWNDAFVLSRNKDNNSLVLKHVKHRNEKIPDIMLQFDGSLMNFTATGGLWL